MPNIVGMSDDPPAETKGSGMPVTGSTPMTVPMLTIACTQIHVVIAIADSRTNGSVVRAATRSPE